MSTPNHTMRRSRSAGSLFLGDHDDWSSEVPCLAAYEDWSSELPCLAAYESSSSLSYLDDSTSRRRHSLLSNGSSSSTGSADPVPTNRTRRATTTTTHARTRASRVRQTLANVQDVKRTMSVYRRANQDLMSDSSARRDAEVVDETLRAMEGLMKTLQVLGTQGATRRRRSSKVLLA